MTDAASAPILQIAGVTRTFTSRAGLFGATRTMRAVDDVSLDVPRGRVTGIVGESGCGKSTLARLALRLIEPSIGSVLFNGNNLGEVSGRKLRLLRRNMQMVFQDPYSAIDPRNTIRTALLEPFQVQRIRLGKAEATSKVDDLIKTVGLSPRLAESYPHQLSGGQKQRVGIARALALQPSLLVLDEPTASLDVSIQAQIIGLLEQLKADFGLTYLFISHDLGLVRYFCDRIVVMYLGRIVEILPKSDSEPRHHYTRALMDSNFEPDPKLRRIVTRLSGEIPSPFNVKPGCAFAPRCQAATDLCVMERPLLQGAESESRFACHHPLG